MAITISVAMQKGGVGKTTTALAVADILGAVKHKRVLLVDFDSQRNTTQASGIYNPDKTITAVLGDECTAAGAIIKCKYYDLLAGDSYLTNVEKALVKSPEIDKIEKKLDKAGVMVIDMTLLRDVLASIQSRYDYIIIDTPPALGNLNYMALVASDYVIIPAEPSAYGLTGLNDITATIKSIKNGLNSDLKVLGVLLVRYNRRTVLSRDVHELIKEFTDSIDTTVFETTIRQSVAVQEAQMLSKPLIDHAPNNNATIDYRGFTTELLKRIKTVRR